MDTLYPDITVQLTGIDGNAFATITAVRRELRRNGVPIAVINSFTDEATGFEGTRWQLRSAHATGPFGDYDRVLAAARRWVTVE